MFHVLHSPVGAPDLGAWVIRGLVTYHDWLQHLSGQAELYNEIVSQNHKGLRLNSTQPR